VDDYILCSSGQRSALAGLNEDEQLWNGEDEGKKPRKQNFAPNSTRAAERLQRLNQYLNISINLKNIFLIFISDLRDHTVKVLYSR